MSTNERRVERAARALARYLPVTRVPDNEEVGEALTDILTNLRHLAAAQGLDIETRWRVSGRHFKVEQENP
jgi:hypothetical protein